MSSQHQGGFGFRVSTAFLTLGLFCLLLEWMSSFLLPASVATFIHQAFKVPLVAVVLGELGPMWAGIGAMFALAHLIVHYKEVRTVVLHLVEIALCVAAIIMFPTY